jgi:hypothetical protein
LATQRHFCPCAANISAIFDAMDEVSANEMLVVTATAMPRPGNVTSDVEPPMMNSLSWPTIVVASPAMVAGSRSQPRPYPVSSPDASRCGVRSNVTVAGWSNLPPSIAIAKRTRSEGVDRNPPAPAKHE